MILWRKRDLVTRLAPAFNDSYLETRLIEFFHFDFCLHEFSVSYEEQVSSCLFFSANPYESQAG
jgi:hypothetical protein